MLSCDLYEYCVFIPNWTSLNVREKIAGTWSFNLCLQEDEEEEEEEELSEQEYVKSQGIQKSNRQRRSGEGRPSARANQHENQEQMDRHRKVEPLCVLTQFKER